MVKIVNLIPIKRKCEIRQVIDQNGNDYILALESIIKYKIHMDKTYSEADWINIIRESDIIIGLEYSYSSLARGRYTSSEIRYKLSRKNISSEAIDKVITRLKELGYLDDRAFVEDYIESYSKTSGKIRIKSDLLRKGIDNSLIEDGLKNIDDEEEKAYQLAVKFNRDIPIDRKQREKIIRHLINRGFDYDTVLSVIRKLGAGQDEIYDL